MITCVVDYVVNTRKLAEFEKFAKRWIELVNAHGGTHHGYFLPSEGANDRALALFSFPSFAPSEQYPPCLGKLPALTGPAASGDKPIGGGGSAGPSWRPVSNNP